MAQFQIVDAAVIVNDEVVGINPNTLSFKEGFGEQAVRATSSGGGKTEQIYAENVESNVAMVKFELPTTVDNVALARSWKTNKNQNVVQIAATTSDGKQLTRTFTGAALVNDYEVGIGSETSIEIEFHANQAI